jgi:hypothetical protein
MQWTRISMRKHDTASVSTSRFYTALEWWQDQLQSLQGRAANWSHIADDCFGLDASRSTYWGKLRILRMLSNTRCSLLCIGGRVGASLNRKKIVWRGGRAFMCRWARAGRASRLELCADFCIIASLWSNRGSLRPSDYGTMQAQR